MTKASAAWKVQLEGAVPGKLDRASYVNCASPGCHGSGWVDAQGPPLGGHPALPRGRPGGRRARSTTPAPTTPGSPSTGYEIQIETTGGEVVTIDSRDIAGKDSIVLSSKVDGGELPDEYFPLRLVGPGLSDAQMPGGIARIVVRVR